MASAEKDDLAEKFLTDILQQDVREIRAVTQYAEKKENQMQALTDKVDGMGWLKRIWDSKVPDVNSRFYHFFTLTQSNREAIKKDIKVYMEFYKEMAEVTSKVIGEQKDKVNKNGEQTDKEDKNGEQTDKEDKNGEQTDKEDKNGEEKDTMNENVLLLVVELNKKLGELYKAAGEGKKTTASSTVYDLHKEFISKHRKLEHMIKRAECVSLNQSQKQTIIEFKKANQSIESLKKDLKASVQQNKVLSDKTEKVMSLNEQLTYQQIAMTEEASIKSEELQELMERNKSLQKNADILLIAAKNLMEENMKHRNKIDQQ